MLRQSEIQFIELIRRLETAGHRFPVAAEAVEQGLRHEAGSLHDKYLRRAERLDGDGQIADMMVKSRVGVRWAVCVASLLFLLSGFFAVTALADAGSLNVFYLLLFFLGANTVLLLWWLVSLSLPAGKLPQWRFDALAAWWARTPLRKAWLGQWREQLGGRVLSLYSGMISHRLWVMTLSGMLAGFVWILLVREYTFHWQSTLLSQEHLIRMVAMLSWLPEKFGFPVPDAQAVADSRHIGQLAFSRAWAGLLSGSIILYGILPRVVAWLFCRVMLQRRTHVALDENLPYFRRLERLWTQKITDADEHPETVSTAPPVPVSVGTEEKIACTLETPAENPQWSERVLGQYWSDWGTVENQQDLSALVHALNAKPAQLLVGIRASALPERGLLRQLQTLQAAAKGGVLVMLLPESRRTPHAARAAQWQQALGSLNIALIHAPITTGAQP